MFHAERGSRNTIEQLVSLWRHECYRVFHDRIVDVPTREWFDATLHSVRGIERGRKTDDRGMGEEGRRMHPGFSRFFLSTIPGPVSLSLTHPPCCLSLTLPPPQISGKHLKVFAPRKATTGDQVFMCTFASRGGNVYELAENVLRPDTSLVNSKRHRVMDGLTPTPPPPESLEQTAQGQHEEGGINGAGSLGGEGSSALSSSCSLFLIHPLLPPLHVPPLPQFSSSPSCRWRRVR